jgi:hypothetical protein
MSVQSFIPTVWESRLLANFHKVSIADVITTKPTEIKGNKVVFNRVGAVAVKDYTGAVTFDGLSTSSVELDMDQKKYFAFKVNDVDKAQSAGDLVDSHTTEAGATLQETVDKFILGAYTAAHADNVIGDDTTPKALDKTNVYDYIVDLGTKLSNKKVPKAERFVVVNAEVLGLLSKDDRFTRNPVVLENGVVEGQKINGLQVVVSEELAKADGKLKIVALHKSAIGYGKQLDEVEAMRLQDDFADGIRGLMVFGSETLRPEALAVLTGTIA